MLGHISDLRWEADLLMFSGRRELLGHKHGKLG